MLKAIEIENFKAFGEPTRIELAPITLIYGQNSAGKSSILQSLNLLKQTHESRESGASLLPRAEDGIVDLGSFRELLFDHDSDRVLQLGLEVCRADERHSLQLWRRFMGNTPQVPLGMRFGFSYGAKSQEVGLHSLSVSIGKLSEQFATFGTRTLTDEEQQETYRMGWDMTRGRRPGRRKRMQGIDCQWVSDRADHWAPVFKAWTAKRDRIAKLLSGSASTHLRQLFGVLSPTSADPSDSAWRQSLETARQFYDKPFTLEAFIQRMTAGWRGTVLGIDGFLPVVGRAGARSALPELDLIDVRLGLNSSLNLPTNDVAGVAYLSGRFIEEALTSLFPMGPFRRPPERWYIFTGTSPEDVGYKGDHLPDLLFRRPDLVDHANRWLRKLDIGYKLSVKPIGEKDSDLFEVRLADTRRSPSVEVGLSDVGFGISQILPFLVQSLATTNQIISIEQPEVHIHPRLQADLGELLAECISDTFSHQFLIETHSEHLVLRLQKLIRDKRLSPSDVSIVFVERGRRGSRVTRLHLDERGDFIDEWPGGFFPERLRELM
jgi:hypothetical protein